MTVWRLIYRTFQHIIEQPESLKMLGIDEKSFKLQVKSQVKQDLEGHASDLNISIRDLINKMSTEIPMEIRNLERIVGTSHTIPSTQTIEKIYSYIYKTDLLLELLTKVPSLIVERFKNDFVIDSKSKLAVKVSKEIVNLSYDDVFNRIYLLTAGDAGVTLEIIKEEYGRRGLEIAEKMLVFGIITIDEDENIVRGTSIVKHPEIRRNILATAIKDYNPVDNDVEGTNYLSLFAGELTDEEYDIFYNEIKMFFIGLGNRLSKSNPTSSNRKKVVFGAILDQPKLKSTFKSLLNGGL